MKKILIGIGIVVLAFVALAGIKAMQIGALIAFGKSFSPPPETVSTAVAREEKWQDSTPAVGAVSAVQGATITAEVPGTVLEINFSSGANVAKGDLLVRLDTSSEDADLRALEAQVELAQTNLSRMKNLRSENAVSQSELDQAELAMKQYAANADAIRATIAKKNIRAPFAGKLGIRQINLGEFLDKGKPVVSLQSLSPVYADSSLPQQMLATLKTGLKIRITTDTYADKHFDGVLTAINPDLDTASRSVRVQGTFENPDQLLRPGMFVRMEIIFPEEQNVLAIPATSILSAPFGDSVYVVEPDTATNAVAGSLIVRQQFVKVGRSRGDFVSVTSGLKPGDRVVNSGMFKLRNKMHVVENNETTPASVRKPNPSDS